MAKPRKVYTREFKISLIHLVDSGNPLIQVARENGVHPNLLTKWRKEFSKDPDNAFSGKGNAYKEQARTAELERLVGKLYAENEFLKKVLSRLGKRVQEQTEEPDIGRDTR